MDEAKRMGLPGAREREELEHVVWEEAIPDLVRGYREEDEAYFCALCGRRFEKGRIFKVGAEEELHDAFGAVRVHGKAVHGETVDYLLGKSGNLTGLSEMQQRVLQLISQGMEDRVIAKELGIAASTVRSHRYKLREKEKQARLFVALMESLAVKTSRPVNRSEEGKMIEPHETATMLDERYNITEGDREKTLRAYFDENGALVQFPAREKKKIIVLRELIGNFVPGRDYSEKEVSRILGRIYGDFATLRRYLIEYGFLERSDDGKVYRVKE